MTPLEAFETSFTEDVKIEFVNEQMRLSFRQALFSVQRKKIKLYNDWLESQWADGITTNPPSPFEKVFTKFLEGNILWIGVRTNESQGIVGDV